MTLKQLAMAVVAVCSLSQVALADEDLAAIDKAAPMFRLPMYNPKPNDKTVLGLDQYVGPDATEKDVKVVLLSFMASYCGPCKKEMPYLELLNEKFRDFGLRVVSVSIDTEDEGMKKVQELIATNRVQYPVLKDRFNLVARRWLGSQSPLPSVFMIRPDGTVSAVHRGYNNEASEVMAAEVETALGIKRGAASVALAPAPASEVKSASASGTGEVKSATATTTADAKTPATADEKAAKKKKRKTSTGGSASAQP